MSPWEYQIVRHPSASSDDPTSPLTLQQFPVRAFKCGSKSKLLETKKGLRKQAAVGGQWRNHKLELQRHLLEKKREVSIASQVTCEKPEKTKDEESCHLREEEEWSR